MMTTITQLSLSDQIVQSINDIEHDHDNDDDTYQLLPDQNVEALNVEEMRKIFKQQYPWSVSDPFPQSIRPEFSPRECLSSPILLSGVESNHRYIITSFDIQKTVVSTIIGNKSALKWIIIALNVLIELCQATITQENSQGKIKREIYFKLSIIASSICLMMSIVEIFHEGKSKGVIWVRKGYFCCWFYHPGMEGETRELFGSIALYFGLISSMIQLIVNVTQKCTKRSNIIKFDYLPLLLSVFYLLAAILGSQGRMSKGVVRCKIHGYNDVEGVLVDGYDSWVFECPEC